MHIYTVSIMNGKPFVAGLIRITDKVMCVYKTPDDYFLCSIDTITSRKYLERKPLFFKIDTYKHKDAINAITEGVI